ncbi:Conidiation protein 6-domain-containing protein [Schizophyllum commune]
MSRTSASSLPIAFTSIDDSVEGKNPGRVAAGLKASIHNPNVSDEAKQSATERLHDMGADVDDAPSVQHAAASGKNEDNVIRGYKATLHNPRVGDEAKERAQEYLEEHDAA